MWFGGGGSGAAGNPPEPSEPREIDAKQNPGAAISEQQQQQQPDKISFHLKTSIFTRRVTLDRDRLNLGLIKQLAVAFLNELYFQPAYPPGTPIADYLRRHFPPAGNVDFSTRGGAEQLADRLLLRKYSRQDESFLPFSSAADIEPDCHICIELSERHLLSAGGGELDNSSASPPSTTANLEQVRMAHRFKQETFFVPTFCAACSSLLTGVFHQGYRCHHCRRNYCPKCRDRAEAAGDTCLLPAAAAGASPPVEPVDTAATAAATGATPTHNSPSSTTPTSAKSDQMSKRKSASQLLHFNLANPFSRATTGAGPPAAAATTASKPAAVPSGDQQSTAKGRASAGALEPVLQQLSRGRQAEQAAAAAAAAKVAASKQPAASPGSMLAVQTANLSVSHQDLTTDTPPPAPPPRLALDDMEPPAGRQLSAGGRASAHDLHSAETGGCSPSSATAGATSAGANQAPKRHDQQHHSFLSMDWIQLAPQAQCGVCGKPLRAGGPGCHTPHAATPPPALCRNCRLQVHAHCQSLAPADCLARLAEASRAAAADDGHGRRPNSQPAGREPSDASARDNNIRLHRLSPSVKHVKRHDATKPIIEGWLKHTTLSDEQARRHYWRLDDTDLTLYESDTSIRYFKAIALAKISRVMSAHALPKRVKEDVLGARVAAAGVAAGGGGAESVAGEGRAKSAGGSPRRTPPELEAQMRAMFAFELATGSMFLVQAADEAEASRWRDSLASLLDRRRAEESTKTAAEDSSAPAAKTAAAKTDAAAEAAGKTGAAAEPPPKETDGYSGRLAQERAPQPSQQRQQQAAAVAAARHPAARPPPATPTGQQQEPNRSRLYNRPRKTIELDPMAIPDHYIAGRYLVERDRRKGHGFEELGSGQFGKVYAAIAELKAEDASKGRWSGVPVAIKEISKARFDLRQQAKLKNEANILSRLDHPGVIILERVHDLPDKIYIVMEQLEDDMLEMIVSTEGRRLNERVTKFLTYQILEALKYLHAQNIAHCDLKPENVLLVERQAQFPQIKLCDFGFAKIIEDNSFRSSLVGTPAYLAPEVVRGERYNRSVDLWSVGVIVYVSLSGEFPFNEGENIHDQISRANFMYPDEPWAKISAQAKNFINSLLRVNCDKRLSASRAQMDTWIQDFQLWCDLSELEVRVGRRWVTDDADFKRWSSYAQEKNLQVPRSAIQLHDELLRQQAE